MYQIIQTTHSYLAYLALGLLLASTIVSAMNLSATEYNPMHAKIYKFTVIAIHTQLVLGLALLFVSPIAQSAYADMATAMKDKTLRLYAVEHPSVNIIAVILATIASAKVKRTAEVAKKYRTALIFFGLALVLILSRIPWSAWL
jgi:Na+-driven multidrug efflux pump